MRIENTLARNISSAGDKTAYDAACKKLLANKIILAWIMKSCIEEYQDIDVNEIALKYIEGSPKISSTPVYSDEEVEERIIGTGMEDVSIKEGTITYDIRFLAMVPVSYERIKLIINVEAQNDFYPGYPIIKRGIYYCSRMISSQYGVEFKKSHYEKIKKVYSIWICANPPIKRQNSINRYSVREECLIGNAVEKRENYDLLTAVMICLGSSDNENYVGILKLLSVLFSSEKEAAEKKRILQEDFDIEMTETLEREVLEMCNLSKGVEEKGIQKGMKEGILSSIKNLMDSMNWSAEEAMMALKIPETEQANYIDMLEK